MSVTPCVCYALPKSRRSPQSFILYLLHSKPIMRASAEDYDVVCVRVIIHVCVRFYLFVFCVLGVAYAIWLLSVYTKRTVQSRHKLGLFLFLSSDKKTWLLGDSKSRRAHLKDGVLSIATHAAIDCCCSPLIRTSIQHEENSSPPGRSRCKKKQCSPTSVQPAAARPWCLDGNNVPGRCRASAP